MTMEWHLVGFALIVFLEVFVALVLVVKLLRFLWHLPRYRFLLDRVIKGLKPLAGPVTQDPAALEKFHWIQCRLILQGSKVFVLALFPRMVAIQGAMYHGEEHSLQNSLDVANILSAYLCTLTILCQDCLTPRILDLWFIAMHFTCVLPLLMADANDVTGVTYVLLLPSFMIGLCAKHSCLFVLGNMLSLGLAAYKNSASEGYSIMTDNLSFAAMCFLIIGAVHAIRTQMLQNVKMGLSLKVRTIDLEAVSALLLGFCDAVVETDDRLHLTEDSRQLSTMLLQGQTRGDLAGRDFLSFFCSEDREHIRQSLKANNNATTMALNARMLDSLGNTLRVELLHVKFSSLVGQQCHLVGMREFQDVYSTVPQLEDDWRTSTVAWDFAVNEILRKAETSLMFDASSFDILTVSHGFQAFSKENGQDESFEGLSVFNLCNDTGPQSFTCRMQDAVNAFDENASSQELIFLRKVELFGQEVDVIVSFQQDKLLNSLVGNVVIVSDSDLQKMIHMYQSQSMKRVPSNSSAGQLALAMAHAAHAGSPSAVAHAHSIGGGRRPRRLSGVIGSSSVCSPVTPTTAVPVPRMAL